MTKHSTITVGMDIGDKYCEICLLENKRVIQQAKLRTNNRAMTAYFGKKSPMLVAMEACTHSPWLSRLLKKLGHQVLVANPRRLQLISKNVNKNDRADAQLLARLACADPALLSPLQHISEEAQKIRAVVLGRDALVRARTELINHVRGVLKALGVHLPKCSAESFHKRVAEAEPQWYGMVEAVVQSIAVLTDKIKNYDQRIETLCEKIPEATVLRQIPGVGPITALAFVLSIGDPQRFVRNRTVGAYVGLTPKIKQSGDSAPQMSISKAGNPYLRRLLVVASHYILGPFGPDSDLRRHGLKIAQRGGKRAKKRAVVATSRKLAVLMLRLMKTGERYQPLYNSEAVAQAA